MSEIYNRIRARREELELSQDELAKKMGYKSRTSINKIEMGVNDIPQSKVIAFAKALDTTTAYLMGCDDENKKPAPTDGDELVLEFISLFRRLSPEHQSLVVAQIKGILLSQPSPAAPDEAKN